MLHKKRYFTRSFCCFGLKQIGLNFFSFGTSTKTYYEILGISKDASQTEIKAAYYKLAKQYHPDVTKGNEEKFKEISSAYETLNDFNKRRQYNDTLKYQSKSDQNPSSRSTQQQYSSQRSNQRQKTEQTQAKHQQYYSNRRYQYDYEDYDEYDRQTRNYHYSDYYYNDSDGKYRRYSQSNYHYDPFYSNFRRDFYEDFESKKREEYKRKEKRDQNEWNAQANKEYKKLLDEAMIMFKNILLVLAVALLAFKTFFKLKNTVPPKNFIVIDEKTDTIYVTDENTYTEWIRSKSLQHYDFQNDPRFIKKYTIKRPFYLQTSQKNVKEQ